MSFQGTSAVPGNAANLQTLNRAGSPTKARNPLDLRAEEDAARRINVGRALISGEAGGMGNTSDLFGKNALRMQLISMSRESGVSFDEDALQYLALAAESRLRALLSQSLSVQSHRTTTSHLRAAPTSSSGKAQWEHSAISDPTSIIDALNQRNKLHEQSFRADRMERIAKETEIQKARDRLIEQAEDSEMIDNSSSNEAGPSTPMKSSTPTFGGVVVGASGGDKSKSVKKSGKKPHVTAEVQHKMSNMTAMRSVGYNKKYSWMSSSPSVSSPLAGKKRKKEMEGSSLNPANQGGGDNNNNNDNDPMSGNTGANGIGKTEGEGSNVKEENNQDSSSSTPMQNGQNGRREGERIKRRKHRIKLTDPSRREVLVHKDGPVERTMPDDRVVTVQDVLFVLERDGVGRGMGTGDDLVRRILALGGMGSKARK